MKWPSDKIFLYGIVILFSFLPLASAQKVQRNNSGMLRQTAQMYERAGQLPQAAEYYARACRENPADISAYLGAKRAYMRIQEFDKFSSLINVLQQRRRDVRYQVDLVFIDFKRGNEKLAMSKWQRVLDENAANQQAYSLVGQAMIENQLYESAIAVYDKGRAILKNKTAFIFELASIYKAQRQFKKLVNEYAAYLETNPAQISFIQSELQRLGREEGTIDPLIKELNRALRSYKTIEWVIHLFLGDLYSHQKQYTKSLEHYLSVERILVTVNDKNIKQRYQKGKYIYALGEIALQAGKPKDAEFAFQTVISEFADGPFRNRAELGLVQVFLLREDYEQAILSLEEFININKKSLDARRALLMIGDISFERLFEIDRARLAYQRALSEYPNNRMQIEVLFKLANCEIAGDSLEHAESFLLKAVKKAGSNDVDLKKNAFLNLARVEFFRAKPTASMNYLQKFSESGSSPEKVDLLENDALELLILLQENSQDSSSLAALGASELLSFQRRYSAAGEYVVDYLQDNPDVLLRSELRLQLVDAYEAMSNYELALSILMAVYEDNESLFRDKALMLAGKILESNLNSSDRAQEHYETILEEFPNSVYIEDARSRIRMLRDEKENL